MTKLAEIGRHLAAKNGVTGKTDPHSPGLTAQRAFNGIAGMFRLLERSSGLRQHEPSGFGEFNAAAGAEK